MAKDFSEDFVPSATLVTLVTVDVEEYCRTYPQGLGQVKCILPAKLINAALDADVDLSQVLKEALSAREDIKDALKRQPE